MLPLSYMIDHFAFSEEGTYNYFTLDVTSVLGGEIPLISTGPEPFPTVLGN